MSRVAKFYGLNEKELRRRGELLERSLQAYQDMMDSVIMTKIVDQPENWKDEIVELGRMISEELSSRDKP